MKWLSRIFMKRRMWSIPYAIFLFIFVVVPLVLIFLYAFQDADGNFTLENFSKFISSPEAANTFVYSIGVAIVTTVLCILLGYPAAYILSNAELCRSKVMVVLFILLALGDFTGNHTITTVAGVVGIFCGLSAIYSAMGQILNAEYGKTVLPLG